MDDSLEGFDKLAKYLINEYKNNNLKNSAISEDCFLYLMIYNSDEYHNENKFDTIKKCK